MLASLVDNRIQIGYGSTWHLLRSLGFHRDRFNAILTQATGARNIAWLDFPAYVGSQTYPKEMPILEGEWRALDFLGPFHPLRTAYESFWPKSGTPPNWDAVGEATFDAQREWLLVEAKAHTGEISKTGTGATKQSSIAMIRRAFESTRTALNAAATVDDWLNGYYQYANRLATLYYLNHGGVPARLFFVYFCGDTYRNHDCPADESGWRARLIEVRQSLGLSGNSEIEKRVHEVFVPVLFPDAGGKCIQPHSRAAKIDELAANLPESWK